ncbi:aspartic proteinase CDR1-like [Impatiens glandulifera]|uniref:aspartic proteinase CDR1-like n=1 Tax=Impatiens glandulifera TaxID=253017 RepID=UPI001FB09032|nr:aspartic proteinase CDR1-like [Impatiens glandulifera]
MTTRGEYLMKFSVGTPTVRQWAILDTASDIVWTQCLECINCFKQTQRKFDPMKSLSYQPIGCEEPKCQQLRRGVINCSGANSNCKYRLEYSDNSLSYGELATETFKLENTSLPGMVYGCSNNNIGVFEKSTAGIVGIGYGPHSLINGLPDNIRGKFSYCLTDPSKRNVRSYISFGANVIMSSPGSISIPLGLGVSHPIYYITLKGVSIQNMRFPFIGVSNNMIDTGSTISYLQANLYYELEAELISNIQDTPVSPPDDVHVRLCYKNHKYLKMPTIIYHFSEDAQLALSMKNTGLEVDDLWCIGIMPTNDTIGVFGNLFQMNYMIGYDLQRRRVSFSPNYC